MKKKARFLSFILAFVMLVPLFSAYGFALEEDSEASSSDSTTTESASVTWEDVIAGEATPEEYYEANNISEPISISNGLEDETSINSTYTVDEGTYYLNNRYTGKYLRYTSSSGALGSSGTLSSLGTSIQWEMVAASGGYYLRSVSDSTKYLGVPSGTTTSSSVEIVTVTSGSVPGRCLWVLSLSNVGGLILQNDYSDRYLYSSGESLYTKTSLGSSGTSSYYNCVWRAVTTSNYSNTSSTTYKELQSFTVSTLQIIYGETKTPSKTFSPSSAMWTSASDFSYSGYSTTYASSSGVTGMLSCENYSYSTATVTATHKVTGKTATFTLVTNPVSAVLVGITVSGHDHSTALTNAKDFIETNSDYGSATKKVGTYTAESVGDFLDDDSYNVFVSRSHGSHYSTSYTYIITSGSSTSATYHLTSKDMSSYDLSNMKLAMFVACYTGYGGSGSNNLPTMAVTYGAKTAVGFEDELVCSTANGWTSEFFRVMMTLGYTVQGACSYLNTADRYGNTTMSSYVICGDSTTKLI